MSLGFTFVSMRFTVCTQAKGDKQTNKLNKR